MLAEVPCSREILGSSIGRNLNYPDWDSFVFFIPSKEMPVYIML
jgi:hypothetical protein